MANIVELVLDYYFLLCTDYNKKYHKLGRTMPLAYIFQGPWQKLLGHFLEETVEFPDADFGLEIIVRNAIDSDNEMVYIVGCQ